MDSVELVEAGPRAGTGKTLEELCHREVVESVGAVEDDTLRGHGLAEILDRLGLARSGGALGGATVHEVDRAHQGAVAAIRQGRDDQAALVAEVLVGVEANRVDHLALDSAWLARLRGLAVHEPVVAHLTEPVEGVWVVDSEVCEILRLVAGVDVEDDQCADGRAVSLCEFASHESWGGGGGGVSLVLQALAYSFARRRKPWLVAGMSTRNTHCTILSSSVVCSSQQSCNAFFPPPLSKAFVTFRVQKTCELLSTTCPAHCVIQSILGVSMYA